LVPRKSFALKTASLILITTTVIACAQVRQAWVAQRDVALKDGAADMALDGADNIHVLVGTAGVFDSPGYAVVKYDASGAELWLSVSDPDRVSAAVDLALDSAGNAYVTGYGQGVSGIECETAKFSAAGERLWVAQYNGLEHPEFGEFGTAVGVDAAGHVYVGGSEGNPRDINYLVLKYDSQGRQLWVDTYFDSEQYHQNRVNDLAVDGQGNVIVTGEAIGTEGTWNYLTIKYSPAGERLWLSRYNSSDDDRPEALALDRAGNIYVTGRGGFDYATVKYNSDGETLWAAQYDGAVHGFDRATAIVVDESGHAHVTGRSTYVNFTGEDEDASLLTLKYDVDGSQLWAARYNLPHGDSVYNGKLALDSAGNVYAVATSGQDLVTLKYNSDGYQQWITRYDTGATETPAATALDDGGNVYVAGSRTLWPEIHFFLLKYEQFHVGGLPRVNKPMKRTAEGDDVILRIKASGKRPLSYRWWCNGFPIPDAVSTRLVISDFGEAEYAVEIRNSVGTTVTPLVRSGSD
jgi:hypothetical protein